MIGRTVGHYRIVEKIGAGGMGVVYRARDEQLHRDVALKVLPAGSFSEPAARARLLREARAAAALNHPHICTIHEVGEADGQAYIVMEFVDGQPLSARLAGRPLPVEEVLRYGAQIADALAHAHKRGLVHRDLKSANVVITAEGRAKVLDFGLAKRLSGEELAEATTQSQASLTQPGTLVGTLAYMAPELLRGQPADARSDIWALGVVLYEMAAGRRPFRGHTGYDLSAGILREAPAPLPSQVPVELGAVIERCLEKKPERRYQSARQLCADLERVSAGEKTMAGRHRKPGRARLHRIRSLAVLPLENLSGDPGQDYFADGMTDALTTDLARLGALKRVLARGSVMRYKGTTKSPAEIAQELQADALITGSVLRAGDRVRVTAQLINPATDEQLWAERYDRELRDVVTLQNEIVSSIATQIHLKLTQQEKTRLARARPVNPEAYEAYLNGLFHSFKLSPRELDTAQEYLQLSLQKDPNYALAFAGMSFVWAARAQTGYVPPREGYAHAKVAALKAIELDETLAEAHHSLATVLTWHDWDWPAAEREFKRAIELNSNFAFARAFYSIFLTSMGRSSEGRAQIERALELDPHNHFFQSLLGIQLAWWGQYDEGIAQLRKALRSEPANVNTHRLLSWALHPAGMLEEELAATKEFFALVDDHEVMEALDRGYGLGRYLGAMRQAAETLAARSKRAHVDASIVANFYAWAGETDQALEWLEKAYQDRCGALVFIQRDPSWDSLRGDPRFRALLQRMNLPQ